MHTGFSKYHPPNPLLPTFPAPPVHETQRPCLSALFRDFWPSWLISHFWYNRESLLDQLWRAPIQDKSAPMVSPLFQSLWSVFSGKSLSQQPLTISGVLFPPYSSAQASVHLDALLALSPKGNFTPGEKNTRQFSDFSKLSFKGGLN